MADAHKLITILIADDDQDSCLLVKEALAETDLEHNLDIVTDGEALIHYLRRQGTYKYLKGTPLPGLILLDLELPKISGQDALREIKSDPAYDEYQS